MDYELMMNGNVKIGQRAPDFEAITTFGPVKLNDYKGKELVWLKDNESYQLISLEDIEELLREAIPNLY